MALFLGELFGTIGLDSSEWDKKLKGAQGSLKTFGVAGVAVAGAAAVAIGAALTKGIVDSIDIEKGTDKIQAQLGLTEEQAGKAGRAAGKLFAGNYGESMEDVNASVASVMSSISGMRDASDADVEAMTIKMMNLSSVMGIDVSRAAQVAGQMITSGIATDGVHAADLLTAAMQRVPENVREDILDAVDEYGPFFSNLGISGDKAMGMLVEASKKGMYGIDKTGDALKEFGIRATDMSAASGDAYKALGLDQTLMTESLLRGGPVASEAFQEILGGLQSLEDPSARSQAALALFGTPLEDLSVTEIPAFLKSLSSTAGGLGDVAGAADKMGQDLTSNAQSGFDGFKRQAEAALITFVQANIMPSVATFAAFLNTEVGPAISSIGQWITNDALPALQAFSQWYTDNLPVIQNWATGIGFLLIPLFLRIAISATMSAAAQVVAWATAGGGAIKAAAIYVAQSYIMIGRFVAMSAAAVAHGVVVAAVWTGQVIRSAVAAAGSFLIQTGIVIGGWVAMAAGATANAVVMAAGWVAGVAIPAAAAVISQAIAVAGVVGGWIAMAAGSMLNAAIMAAAWFVALGPVGWVIAAIIGLVALVIANWDSVSSFTQEAWANVGRFLWEAMNNITRTVSEGVENVLGFFRDLPGKIGEFFAGAGTWLLDAGRWILEGFLKGITDGFSAVKDFVGGIGSWIAENKGPKAYDKALLIPAGGWIMDGLEDGLEGSIPSLQKTLGGVSATIAAGIDPTLTGSATYGLNGAGSSGQAALPAGSGFTQNNYITEATDVDEVVQKVWAKFQFKAQEAGIRVGV